MTLTFVSFEDTYSIYRDTRTGQYVNLQAGTRRRLVDYCDLDILREYRTFIKHGGQHHLFDDHLRENVVTDPDEVDNMVWCEDCDDPELDSDNMLYVNDTLVCDDCRQRNYSVCGNCEDWTRDDDMNSTLHDESVCQGCLEDHYGYCDECDGYYHFDVGCGDDHDEDCGCDVPHPRHFKVPNGDDTLGNDERMSVSLPAGFVSDEGIGQMAQIVRQYGSNIGFDGAMTNPETGQYTDEYRTYLTARQNWYQLSYQIADVGTQWQTGEGNFTKRLSKFAYKTFGLKVPADLLTQIGNIGSQHSQGTEAKIEFTRQLNLPAHEFVHAGSCWWTEYASSRCTLKSNGGLALRSFNSPYYENEATGRAWIQPVSIDADGYVDESAETESPDGYIVFNGYGDLGGYGPARIVAQMTGMTYCKINFNYGEAYINGNVGYLVSSVDNVAKFTDGGIELDSAVHARVVTYA